MNDEIKIILDDYSDKFRDYAKYIKSNDWSKEGDYEGWDLENNIISDMLSNLSQFKNEIGDAVHYVKVQEFFQKSVKTINLHLDRTAYYLEEYKWSTRFEKEIRNTRNKIDLIESKATIGTKDEKELHRLKDKLESLKEAVKREMVTQSEIFTKTNKIKIQTSKLNVVTDGEKGSNISSKIFFEDKKATLYLREFLSKHIPIVKTKIESLGIDFSAPHVNPSTSKEMLINMNPKDIPPYDTTKHFFEQPKSTIEFWEEERRKNVNGINIGGYFIHPWLYFHLNSFKIASAEDASSEPVHPDFRDNEYFFAEMLKLAEEDGRKALLMYGSRRISKALKDSELLYKPNGDVYPIGDSKVGDYIIGGDGKPTKILGVYPQGKVQLYRVELIDGRGVECCKDHLWGVRVGGEYKVLNLLEIIELHNSDIRVSIPTYTDSGLKFISINKIYKTSIDNATCIKVDNKDKLFKTTENIVTHNTTTMSSYILHKLITILNASCKAVAFNREPDLDALISNISIANLNMHPALNVNANNLDFDNGVKLGLKLTPQNRLDYSTLSIVNLEGGTKKSATQKTAGGTPNGFLFDEVGKGPCIKPWMAAVPSFVKKDGKWRTVPLLSGCVCAGTKVYNHKGELVNIEDLQQSDGILGFDQVNQKTTKEPITWMQPPSEKPCYRITTRKGHQLECSYEHPILVRHRNKREVRNGKSVRKIEFIPTEELKVGQQVVINESVDIWGIEKMWEPRLVGWFIGDGYYGENDIPSITSCDNEVNNYIDSKFETSVKKKQTETKDGKILKQRRLKGTSKYLRELGIYGQSKAKKTLPKDVYKYDKESICELIGGLLDSDGHASFSEKHPSAVCLTFGHESLVKEIVLLLNKLGVHPTYNKRIGKPTKLVPKECEYYVISISDKRSLNTLYKNVKFSIKYKQDSFDKIIKHLETKKEQIPSELENCRLDTISNIEYIGVKPIYNLTAGLTNTYIANNIVTHNTAGEAAVSKDAERMLKNPEDYHLMPMHWDLLEKGVDQEYITWNKGEKFAMFVPAQLSLEAGSKIEKSFAEFLELPESSPLENITMHVTNWEEATKMFKERRERYKRDLDLYSAESNSFPITPEDCYITPEKNKFPGQKARLRKKQIEDLGEDGAKVILKKNPYTDMIDVSFSNQPTITEYPYSGGNFDAPIVLLEILEDGEIPPLGLYCIGFDDVKHNTTSGDSVISATVFKRDYKGGEWANRIVAWYDSRPEKKDYYRNLFLLMKYFNARVLAENEDNGFLEYLEDLDLRTGSNHVLTHISEGVGLASEDNLNRNKNRKFGWSPTPNNIYHLENKIVAYTKRDGIVIGAVEDLDGIDTINHPMLLEELYRYKKDQNADRIRSFGLALTLAQYYDKTYQYLDSRKRYNSDESENRREKRKGITRNGLTNNSRLKQF